MIPSPRETLLDALAGLRAAPARAILSALSLAAGFLVLSLLLAVWTGLDREAATLASSFGADAFALLPPGGSAPSWTRPLADSLRAALRHRAHVSAVRPIHPGIPDAPPVLLATDEHWLPAHGWRILRGRPLDGADIHRAAPVVLLPDAAARAARLSPGDTYPLGPATLTLVGTTTAPADTPPLVPWTLRLLDPGDAPPPADAIDRIWIRARPGHSPDALLGLLLPRLAPLGLPSARPVTPDTLLSNVHRWRKTLAWTAGSGALLALLLGATSLAGLLLAAVRERIPEIGLRRALGATPTDVASLFVAEALLLTLASSLLGTLSAALLLHSLGATLPLPWAFSPILALLPILLSLPLAAATAALPALAASRLPPAEALRND